MKKRLHRNLVIKFRLIFNFESRRTWRYPIKKNCGSFLILKWKDLQLDKENCRVNERKSSLKLSEKFCSSNHVTNDVTTLKAHMVWLHPSKKRYSPRVPHHGPEYSPLNRETADVTWLFLNVLKHCFFQLFNVCLHTDKRMQFQKWLRDYWCWRYRPKFAENIYFKTRIIFPPV